MTRNGISRSEVATAGVPAASLRLPCYRHGLSFLLQPPDAAADCSSPIKLHFSLLPPRTPLQTETFDTTPGINPMSNTAPFSTSLKNIMLFANRHEHVRHSPHPHSKADRETPPHGPIAASDRSHSLSQVRSTWWGSIFGTLAITAHDVDPYYGPRLANTFQ